MDRPVTCAGRPGCADGCRVGQHVGDHPFEQDGVGENQRKLIGYGDADQAVVKVDGPDRLLHDRRERDGFQLRR